MSVGGGYKAMKEAGKLWVKEIILVAVCAVLGIAALAVTYLIPNRYMYDNIKKSAIILHNEGLGTKVGDCLCTDG